LTGREIEILRLLAEGCTNREIGDRLFISVGTVKKHIENVMSKAGIHRRAQLATFALTLQLDGETRIAT
jgi:DNA-binding NarL/FixJ family response regulator